jgi:hypothetical protein
MRKSKKLTQSLVEELEKTGNALNSCSKLGLARATYYRWRKDDLEFRNITDEAIEMGRANMVDFAESKLIKNVESGNQRAIEFLLKYNSSRYRNIYGREFQEQVDMLQKKYREEFGFLQYITSALFEAIPEETLINIFNIDAEHQIEEASLTAEEKKKVNEIVANKYMSSMFKKRK